MSQIVIKGVFFLCSKGFITGEPEEGAHVFIER